MTLKALIEKRAELQASMDAILNTATTENRAMTEEEISQFDDAEKQIKAIDATIEREERARGIKPVSAPTQIEERAEADRKAFADYICGRVAEMRAGEQNVTMANNAAIIPTSIANTVIKAVVDLCPILAGATRYNVPGQLKVPVWGAASGHNIAVGYQQEFTEITADAGKFTSVDLSGYLAGALTLIGKSVINNATLNVTDFIVRQMAEEIARWLEGQLLAGTGSSAATGALNTTNTMTAAASSAVTADELIELQAMVKQAYQGNACWTMHPETYAAIKALKDGNDRYLLQDDFTSAIPFRMLGKPVYLSDNMPKIGSGNKAVLYGDYSGISVNFRENIGIEVLREKYATQHAIGVISWFEFDSKVTNHQKLAALTMASSASA